jgi:drug/metabolite transporter (DMT)-like permease
MAKCLSWAAIFFAALTIALILLMFKNYVPPDDDLVPALMLLAAVLAPLLAVIGLLLTKRGGKPAPRLARVALAIAIGAFSWPLLIFAPFFLSAGY